MTVTITIPGQPVPKARARLGAGGRTYTPKRTREYEQAIAWQCRADRVRLGSAPLEVTIELWARAGLRGDLDNYAKSVLDGLQAGEAIENDRQVVVLRVAQVIAAPKEQTVIHLRSLEEAA